MLARGDSVPRAVFPTKIIVYKIRWLGGGKQKTKNASGLARRLVWRSEAVCFPAGNCCFVMSLGQAHGEIEDLIS